MKKFFLILSLILSNLYAFAEPNPVIVHNGDVTVKNGVEYEIEASGTVTLEDGFKVEKGATFSVCPASF